MFDDFFDDLKSELNQLSKQVQQLQDELHPSPRYFDTKGLAELSGIPYNTLMTKKSLLPDSKKAFKIGVKTYYPREVAFEWVEHLQYQ